MADMRKKTFTVKECMEQAMNKLAEGGAVWNGVNPRELRGEMVWTSEKPKREGWYWFILSDSPWILRVSNRHERGGGLAAYFPVRGWTPLEEIEESMWSGPLIAPMMPGEVHPIMNSSNTRHQP